jgi:hypothetical protein
MLPVARAAERMDRAVCRRDFSVRRHRHVYHDEGQAGVLDFLVLVQGEAGFK